MYFFRVFYFARSVIWVYCSTSLFRYLFRYLFRALFRSVISFVRSFVLYVFRSFVLSSVL